MPDTSRLIEIAEEILTWWEDAQYIECNGHNAFDEDEDYMFDKLRKAIGESNG